MSSALLAALFAILGAGLAITSTACFVLWRKVRALTSANMVSRVRSADRVFLEPTVHAADPTKLIEARLAKVEAALAMVPAPTAVKPARRVDPPQPATAEGPTLISVPNLASPPASTSEAAAELDRRFGPIWGMADEGVSAETIARETGYPIGQVELILGLRRRLLVAGTGTGAGAALDV